MPVDGGGASSCKQHLVVGSRLAAVSIYADMTDRFARTMSMR